MELREKVIKGLECCLPMTARNGLADCKQCPYDRKITLEGGLTECCHDLMTDALALLKAQEPRVMGVDEVREWVGKQRVDREPICVEVKDNICAWIVSDEYWDMQMDINLSSDLYGNTWRCWTSRPTDEQREAVKWE